VTVTLPHDVLSRLTAIDTDLGRAIVTTVERASQRRPRAPAAAEVSAYGSHAVILVNPVRALKRLPGVQLIPVGNGRALISLEQPHAVSQLELAARDLIERNEVTEAERRTLGELADILRSARQSHHISVEERTIIVLEPRRRVRRAKPGRAPRSS
jgi:hypothetical protein